ncbi:MAG: formate dehydrogenase accessory protein FdhE [Xanthobacteraceae bacterium]
MTQIGGGRHEPVPIGEVATPPFVKLPDPAKLFSDRAARFAFVARNHALEPYLHFLAGLCESQSRILDGLPEPDRASAEALALAHEHAMPPLDRHRFSPEPAFDATLDRLLAQRDTIGMPDSARQALISLAAAEAADRIALTRAALADAPEAEKLGEHVFVAAALQVHFSRLAAGLDAARLVPVGDGACPACGSPPVASMVVGWLGAHGTRFCACWLCGTLWNYVRIKCTVCGSNEGIAYQEVEGAPGLVKAETCDSCRSYVKILQQHKDPALEPFADDCATLAIDMLMRETGYRRGAVNPFLLGY